MLEKEIEKKVCQYAKQKGFLTFKLNSITQRGIPDRIFAGYDNVFFIEFKSTIGKLRNDQKNMISKLREKGAEVYIVNSVESGQYILDQYAKQK